MKKFFAIGFILGFVIMSGLQGAVKSESSKYVVDTLKWVEEMAIDETNVPDPHLLVNPYSAAEDSRGNIYIVDTGAHNVKKFISDGTFVSVFGRQGAGPGDLNNPASIVFADGKLVVNDVMNRRLAIFTTDGKFVDSIKNESSNELFKRLLPLASGSLAVEFLKMSHNPKDPQGVAIRTTRGAMQLGKLSTIFEREVRLRSFVSKPIPTNIIAPFPANVCWDVLPDGKLVIGYSEKYEIGVYDSTKGKIATLSRKYEPVSIEELDKKAFFGKLRFFVDGKITNKVPDHVKDNTVFPKNKPAFEAIFADSNGYVLVFPFQRANERKDRRQVDVFRADGTFVHTVTIIGDMNLYALSRGNGDYFWSRKTNEDEEAFIVKYRLKN